MEAITNIIAIILFLALLAYGIRNRDRVAEWLKLNGYYERDKEREKKVLERKLEDIQAELNSMEGE